MIHSLHWFHRRKQTLRLNNGCKRIQQYPEWDLLPENLEIGSVFFFSKKKKKKKNMINRKYDPFRLNDQIERSIPKWEVVVHPWKSLSSRVKTRNGNCLNSSTWFHKEAEWRADCFWIESNPLHRSRWRMLNGSIKTLSVTWSMLADGGTIWQSSNLTKRKRTNTWNV